MDKSIYEQIEYLVERGASIEIACTYHDTDPEDYKNRKALPDDGPHFIVKAGPVSLTKVTIILQSNGYERRGEPYREESDPYMSQAFSRIIQTVSPENTSQVREDRSREYPSREHPLSKAMRDRVYRVVCEGRGLFVDDVARRSGIPRTTAYHRLDQLIRNGKVKVIKKHNVTPSGFKRRMNTYHKAKNNG